MRIIYYYGRLNTGGAERSSVRLLNAFVERGHDVTLLVRWGGGALESAVDPKVRIRPLRRGHGILAARPERHRWGLPAMPPVRLARWAVEHAKGLSREAMLRVRRPRFDLAITGYHGYDPGILMRLTRSRVHFFMLRSSSAVTDHERRTATYLRRYATSVDGFICVSEFVRRALADNYPDSSHKAHTIYNIVDAELRVQGAGVPALFRTPRAGDAPRVLTLCRLEENAKGLNRMVDACKELVRLGRAFRWYIVGDGPDRGSLDRRIAEEGLEGVMIVHPMVADPFPYYQHADLVAVLSYIEGLSGVVNEAKLMKRPLIATRFSGIEEQIAHGLNGHIVENTLDAIIQGMDRLICDASYRESLAVNGMPREILDNDLKVRQFEDLFERCARARHTS